MQTVHLAPLWSVVGGAAGLAVVGSFGVLSTAGWIAGLLYLVVSNALLARGLRRSGTVRFGPANVATTTRSTLVGIVTALVATSFTESISVPLLIGLTVPALALDAIDGWIARRTDTITELGGRFDMEVDAFLILALSAYVAQELGWWVLIIGLMRYALAIAEWFLPWLRVAVPFRYWRKVVAAVAGISLTLVASGLAPRGVEELVMLLALSLLVESFGRDVIWLFARHRAVVTASGRRTVRGGVAIRLPNPRGEGVADVGRGV